MTCVLVIQHEDDDPIGVLGDRLAEHGIDLDIRRGHDGHQVPVTLDTTRHAGLIVLGGSMGADDDAEHAWLTHTKALLRHTIVGDVAPVLGICLGHQLIASALGGRVGRNPRGRTWGVIPVGWSPDAADASLLAPAAVQVALHYNDDIVLELPPDATVLARTGDDAVQAARFGPRAWGVQFHPEVEIAVFGAWTGVPSALLQHAYAAAPQLAATADASARGFAAAVAAQAARVTPRAI